MRTLQFFTLASAIVVLPLCAHATAIWSAGPNDITFTKATNADFTLPQNQDQITTDVAITRGNTMGIYNADLEEAFNIENGGIGVDNVSPAGTEWAFSGLNGNPVFSYGQGAAEYQNLTFSDWETASGGTHSFPVNLVENAAVVHLVSDDIYLDLQFLSWGVGMSGDNSFSYIRAVAPVPEPASMSFLAAASVVIFVRRRKK